MVQACRVLKVFAHVKHVEQLLDVALALNGNGQLLPPDGAGETRAHRLRDLFQAAQLAGRQLDGGDGVGDVAEASLVFAILGDVVCEVNADVFGLSLKF